MIYILFKSKCSMLFSKSNKNFDKLVIAKLLFRDPASFYQK